MSHIKLRPFIVKVSVLGYFPLYYFNYVILNNYIYDAYTPYLIQ